MHPLLIRKNVLLRFAIIGFAVTMIGAAFKITHSNFFGISSSWLLGFGTGILLVVWFTVVLDVIKNRIRNPLIWYFALLFFGGIASILYLINRENIIIKR